MSQSDFRIIVSKLIAICIYILLGARSQMKKDLFYICIYYFFIRFDEPAYDSSSDAVPSSRPLRFGAAMSTEVGPLLSGRTTGAIGMPSGRKNRR